MNIETTKTIQRLYVDNLYTLRRIDSRMAGLFILTRFQAPGK